VLATVLLYQASRRWPERVGGFLRERVARQLPGDARVDPDFTPRTGRGTSVFASCPTATSSRRCAPERRRGDGHDRDVHREGVRLAGGAELDADVVVTATGLTMVTFGGDRDRGGRAAGGVRQAARLQGHDVRGRAQPGLCVGYINASWTLRADLTSRYVCRLVNYMDRHDIDITTPDIPPEVADADEPLMMLSSGYVRRAAAALPRQGTRRPWRMRNNYLTDLPVMLLGRIDDGNVRFSRLKARA